MLYIQFLTFDLFGSVQHSYSLKIVHLLVMYEFYDFLMQ